MDDDTGINLLMKQHKRPSSVSSKSSSNSEVIKIELNNGSSRSSSSATSSSSNSSSSSSASSSSSGSSKNGSSVSSVSIPKKKISQDDIINMKKELLYQFDRLEKKGIKIPRKFTLASSLDEMKVEYDRLKKDREVDISVKFQRRMLMTFITGMEFVNKKFDPFDFDLDGWSESINDNINDYDDIFEELHDKYKGKANLPPEIKLMFALGGSAFMFHLQKTAFKSSLPGLSDVIPQRQQKKKEGGGGGIMSGLLSGLMGGGGLGGMLSGLMGGNDPPPQPRSQMRGPSNVDDILNELNMHKNVMQPPDRVETMSTISESEFSEIPDDASAMGAFVTENKTGKRTLNI